MEKTLENWKTQPAEIVIRTHIRPDYDAYGTALGLAWALKETFDHNGRITLPLPGGWRYDLERTKVVVIADKLGASPLSQRLPGFERMLAAEDMVAKVAPASRRVEIVVDCGDNGRVYGDQPAGFVLWFDHHSDDESRGHVVCANSSAGSCAQIVYRWLRDNAFRVPREALECFAVGLIGDTVGLTKAGGSELNCAAALAEALGDGRWRELVEAWGEIPKAKAEFLARAGHAEAVDGSVVELLTSDVVGADTSVISGRGNEYLREEGTHTAVVARQDPSDNSVWYVQVRTRPTAPKSAQTIAESLGGGGHPCASGCKLTGTAEAVAKRLRDALS